MRLSKRIQNNLKKKENTVKTELDSVKRANESRSQIKELEEDYEKRKTKTQRFTKFYNKFLKSGWLKPIKDINFTPLPSLLAHRSDLIRQYQETQLRNTATDAETRIDPTFQEVFYLG